MATTITINAGPTQAFINTPFTFTFEGTGGDNTKYQWSGSNLPAGLSLNASTGVLSGTPTAAAKGASVINVTDGTDTGTENFTVAVSAALTASGLPPLAYLGKPYSFDPLISGGLPPYHVTISPDVTPVGLAIDPTTGVVSGVPTMIIDFNGTITITDSASPANTATLPMNGSIVDTLVISPTAIPSLSLGVPANVRLTQTTKTNHSLTWMVLDGSLPEGLSLKAVDLSDDAELVGTPVETGLYNFVIGTENDLGQEAMQPYSIQVISDDETEALGDNLEVIQVTTMLSIFTANMSVTNPTAAQKLAAAEAINDVTVLLNRQCRADLLAVVEAQVKASPALFSPTQLTSGLDSLSPYHVRTINSLFGAFYAVINQPTTPVPVSDLIRNFRRMPAVAYLRNMRARLLAA